MVRMWTSEMSLSFSACFLCSVQSVHFSIGASKPRNKNTLSEKLAKRWRHTHGVF